ncbi:MAG: hypothetical protein H6737_14870 [Alphaproteobacteria bacterium]|nr:hypothetical protein [Alphaproteobacteria bacterium]
MWLVSMALAAPGWDALDSEEGWETLADASAAETGPITVEQRTAGGALCLRGRMHVDTEPDVLFEVVSDIPSEPRWSSETLVASEILGRSGGSLDYYQHLAVPRWTMAADRFWVLRGRDASRSTTRELRWERFDWASDYPDLAARIARDHPGAVEPDPNLGFWRFEQTDAGTRATYAVCTSAGGAIPKWIQRKAATQALPGTMADVAREAARRSR